MPATYTLISSNVLSSNAASVTFSSIPATYTDLVVRISTRVTRATGDVEGYLSINGTTTNYSYTILGGTPGSSSSTRGTTYVPYVDVGANATSNAFSSGEIYIPSYTASQNKPIGVFSQAENNVTTNIYQYSVAALWRNTSAITSLTFTPFTGDYVTGSSFYLYGISNA
jgi:hypothetical protein